MNNKLSNSREVIERIKEIEKDCLYPPIFKEAIGDLAQELYNEDILEEIKEEEKSNHLEANFVDLEWEEFYDWRNKLIEMIEKMNKYLPT